MRWFVCLSAIFGALAACGTTETTSGSAASTTGDQTSTGAGPDVACTGTCACDQAAATCTCSEGSTCAATCKDDCRLECAGEARCDLTCGERCEVDCSGKGGCLAHVGPGSTAACSADGICEVTCDGDCSLGCPGKALCLVHCAPGAACAITSCDSPTTCPGTSSRAAPRARPPRAERGRAASGVDCGASASARRAFTARLCGCW